jgi:TetR/AcrR family transcriptional regulator, mexJK operon transcriptional repressor
LARRTFLQMNSSTNDDALNQAHAAKNDLEISRDRIISAAADLFRKEGFNGVSMNDIASGARTSKRTIYQWFNNKLEILEAVLVDFVDEQFRRIRICDDISAPPLDKLESLAEALTTAASDPEGVSMVRLQIAQALHFPEVTIRLSARGLSSASRLLGPILAELGTVDIPYASNIIYDHFVLAPLHRALTGLEPSQVRPRELLEAILSAASSTH